MSQRDHHPDYDELLERILDLEQEVKHAKAAFQDVRAAIKDLRAALDNDRSNIITCLEDIDNYLFPVVYKVFPELAVAQREIDRTLGLTPDNRPKKKPNKKDE